MLSLLRRFGGNRVYWRDCDLDRIAKHLDLTTKDFSALPLLTERDALPPAIDRAQSKGALNSGEEFRFILSSAAVDSYGDTINQLGWDFSRVDKNFPVLAFHDGKSAIGQWSARALQDGKLKATFAHASASAYAQFVVGQLRERTLRASSVGFIPGEWEWSSDPKRKWGIDFKQGHVLLEASIVSIPANPDALLEHHVAGAEAKTFPVKLARDSVDALRAHF